MRHGLWLALLVGFLLIGIVVWVWPREASGPQLDRMAGAPTSNGAAAESSDAETPIPTSPYRDKRPPTVDTDVPEKAAEPKSDSARLRLQILGADGSPAAGRTFECVVSYEARGWTEQDEEEVLATGLGILRRRKEFAGFEVHRGSSGDDGFIACAVKPGEEGRLRLLESKPAAVASPGATKWLAVLRFPAVAAGEEHVLPVVRMSRVPLLVGGWVEDENGDRIEGATVYALPAGNVPRGDKRRAAGLVDDTDALGRFDIPSAIKDMELVVWAHKDSELASALVRFVPGQRDLIVTVPRVGGIQGRVSTATAMESRSSIGVRPVTPTLHLVPEGESDDFVPRTRHLSPAPYLNTDADGRFRRMGIPAGTYRLSVWVGLTLAREVPGIQILPGELNKDPRIQDLVVAQDMELGAVTVTDETGAPIAQARVVIHLKRGSNTGRTGDDGRVDYPVPKGAVVRVTAEARHYLSAELSSTSLPAVVVLRRGLTVVVRPALSASLETGNGIHGHWLVLLPESEAEGALAAGRNPVPESVHVSRIFRFKDRREYTLTGVAPERYAVYVVPRTKTVTSRTGSFQILGDAQGVRVGVIDLSGPSPDLSPVLHVDVSAVHRLHERLLRRP